MEQTQVPIEESRRRADESISLGERVGARWSYLTLDEQRTIVTMVEALTESVWDGGGAVE